MLYRYILHHVLLSVYWLSQSSLPHRETIVEGLFSLSQLLPLALESKIQDDSATDRKTRMYEKVFPGH